jgi:hypothetical protein
MPQRIAVSRNRHETLIATHRLSIACTGDFASFDNPGRAGEFRCLGQRVVSILCCPLLQGKWGSQQDLLNFTGGSSEMRH